MKLILNSFSIDGYCSCDLAHIKEQSGKILKVRRDISIACEKTIGYVKQCKHDLKLDATL